MTFDFSTDVPAFDRSYAKLDDDLCRVRVGDVEATLQHDRFWEKFANGWEPETERIYRKLVAPGSTVLDIGAWIGSTILFALACGADKVIAVEPNPGSFSALVALTELNPDLAHRIHLEHVAVSNREGVLTMGLADGEDDTSTSGLAGNDFEVQSTTLPLLLSRHNPGPIDLVKIDIEGAEVLLAHDLERFSKIPGQSVHLSIHVPFFPQAADIDSFIDALRDFQIYDDRGDQLAHREFAARILSSESHPHWGTQHGNFFEVLMISG